MVRFVGWACLMLGVLTLGLTLAVYRALVARDFTGSGTYLVRGLLVSAGFLLIWAAAARDGGPLVGALGLVAGIGAVLMTRHALDRRL